MATDDSTTERARKLELDESARRAPGEAVTEVYAGPAATGAESGRSYPTPGQVSPERRRQYGEWRAKIDCAVAIWTVFNRLDPAEKLQLEGAAADEARGCSFVGRFAEQRRRSHAARALLMLVGSRHPLEIQVEIQRMHDEKKFESEGAWASPGSSR